MAIGPDGLGKRKCCAEELHWIVAMPQTDAGTRMKFFFARHTADFMTKGRDEVKDDEQNAPKFSTAIGWKIRLFGKLLYFINFCSAANSATIPTPVAALSTYDCASMLTTVTSQASDFPPWHRIKLSPSGRLPSCLTNPVQLLLLLLLLL